MQTYVSWWGRRPEKSTDVTDLLLNNFNIAVATTGGYASWINGVHKCHKKSIKNMVRAVILEINQHENKWWCVDEKSAEVYRCKIYSSMYNTSPHFTWYVNHPSIHELSTFGCSIYSITQKNNKLDKMTQEGYFMEYILTAEQQLNSGIDIQRKKGLLICKFSWGEQ